MLSSCFRCAILPSVSYIRVLHLMHPFKNLSCVQFHQTWPDYDRWLAEQSKDGQFVQGNPQASLDPKSHIVVHYLAQPMRHLLCAI